MNKIDWNSFRVKNKNYNEAFEELCYQLFCRKHKFSEGIMADFNQAGLETYPKKSGSLNIMVGFQSKFFESKTDYGQIKKSILKALKLFGNDLNEITIFLNSNALLSSESAKEIVSIAKKQNVRINWFTQSKFQIALNQPNNLDLAQLYFGFGDEENFIKSNISIADSNFIQSSGFLNLPIVKLPGRELTDLKLKAKLSLLTGNPGSGKSVIIKYLYCKYAKLFEKKRVFDSNHVLPMLVNLKDCYSDSLENLIRQRQKDYQVQNKSIRFIYILDGLDELNSHHGDLALRFIKRLSETTSTDKIIISCRRGSLNKLTINEYFDSFDSYDINELTFEDIERYFDQKDDKDKNDKLYQLKAQHSQLIEEITDIFLVKLLWDTINDLTDNTTIIDLLELKINGLLKETPHRTNLRNLNLLVPKEKEIIRINEKLSYRFSKKYQYRFKHSAIGKFLCKEFPQLNYEDINRIASYNLNTFFDKSVTDENNDTYIYQHRRYQEYFFARRLKKKFERDINIIRETGVILSPDFFDDIFMKYLQKEYKKTNDIPSLALLASITYYQKNGDQWYINDSVEFVDALACQKPKTLEFLLNDDVLNTKNYISGTYANALNFFERGKSDAALTVIETCTEELGRFENTTEMKDLEGQLYYKFMMLEEGSKTYGSFFLKKYRKYFKNFATDSNSLLDNQSPKEYAVKCYFKVGIKHFKEEMNGLIKELTNDELSFFLDLLSTAEFLPLFFDNKELQKAISGKLTKYKRKPTQNNLPVFFFRTLLKATVTEKQINEILELLRPSQPNVREFSFIRLIHPFALGYIIAGDKRFIDEVHSATDFPSADDVVKYCVLYDIYCKSLEEQISFSKNLVDYRDRFQQWYDSRPRIKTTLTRLWAYIFYSSKGSRLDYLQLINALTFDFDALVFLSQLSKLDLESFSNVITEGELLPYENSLKSWKDDYSKYIDRCFVLSGMYSQFNVEKSIKYIKEAFINSKLRHGWRKDIFISDFFNEAFEKVLAKNWLTKKELKKYAESIFSLNLRLYEITDRDHTRYGILNFLEAIGSYDLKLAYKYLKKFKQKNLEKYVENLSIVALLIQDIKCNAIHYNKVCDIVNGWRFREENYKQSLFDIEMEVLSSNFYDDEVKKTSFAKAFDIVTSVKGKFDYQQGVIDNYYVVYDSYCKLNEKENILDTEIDSYGSYNNISQSEFSKMIHDVSNHGELQELYSLYNNYENRITIEDKDIWKKWVDKTLSIDGNIDMFIDLTKEQQFLTSGFWGISNSKCFDLGVACCLENPNTKEQMESFLIENGGHGSFYKMIYVYTAMNEKEKALEMFKKFHQFCIFLIT
ncbi:NACHT domain-containing protein [Chryseobacterium sp. IT-36CA2]|uniref:NACHT domain-containing protein n=1 Tax=Chryseobacterium sp. IT-36CA2 TaxID=3026460 RepID=UPI0039E0A48C